MCSRDGQVTSLGLHIFGFLLFKHREDILIIKKNHYDVGVVTESVESGVMEEPGQVHVAGHFGHLSLEELHVALELERHFLVSDALNEVSQSYVASERSGERVIVTADYNNLARREQQFIFHTNGHDGDFVRHRLQCHVNGLGHSSRHIDAWTLVHNSYMADI